MKSKEEIEAAARVVYSRLCPHAPKDLPREKSTTMTAFVEGYELALKDLQEDKEDERRERNERTS